MVDPSEFTNTTFGSLNLATVLSEAIPSTLEELLADACVQEPKYNLLPYLEDGMIRETVIVETKYGKFSRSVLRINSLEKVFNKTYSQIFSKFFRFDRELLWK